MKKYMEVLIYPDSVNSVPEKGIIDVNDISVIIGNRIYTKSCGDKYFISAHGLAVLVNELLEEKND